MDSSLPQSHVCISNPLPDTHNPSPCDLYQRMIKQERMVMECERRSDSRNLIRRGWARVKSALVKWEEGFKEKRGKLVVELSLYPMLLTCQLSSHRSSPSFRDILRFAPRTPHLRLLKHVPLNSPPNLLNHVDLGVHRAHGPDRELFNHPHRQPLLSLQADSGRDLRGGSPAFFTPSLEPPHVIVRFTHSHSQRHHHHNRGELDHSNVGR